MEARKWSVAAPGRVIMDAVQAEWEPLSHWELDQRLDRAVEEMIEADLVAQVQEQKQASQQEDSSPAQTATPQPSESRSAQGSALQRAHATEAMEANPTVQVGLLAHALHVEVIFMIHFLALHGSSQPGGISMASLLG